MALGVLRISLIKGAVQNFIYFYNIVLFPYHFYIVSYIYVDIHYTLLFDYLYTIHTTNLHMQK
jgi:hypothetical protein